MQNTLFKRDCRKIFKIFLARQVVDIAVTLLTQLKLCVLSSKYKTVNP